LVQVITATLSYRAARALAFTGEKIRKLIFWVDANRAKTCRLYRAALPTPTGGVHFEIGVGDPPHAFYFELGDYAVRLETGQAGDLADMLERLDDDACAVEVVSEPQRPYGVGWSDLYRSKWMPWLER
jgi:hypothetical protein